MEIENHKDLVLESERIMTLKHELDSLIERKDFTLIKQHIVLLEGSLQKLMELLVYSEIYNVDQNEVWIVEA